jgi:hypothetical protein
MAKTKPYLKLGSWSRTSEPIITPDGDAALTTFVRRAFSRRAINAVSRGDTHRFWSGHSLFRPRGKQARRIRSLRLFFGGVIALTMVLIASPHRASARQLLTIGVLKFGTVSWQLDTLKAHRLDEAADLNVEVLSLASTNATTVALQAGEVDLIVSDWVWVMR